MQVSLSWNSSDLHFSLGLGLNHVCETGGILCIKSPLHQITKKLVNANVRVFLMQRLWEERYIWHRSLFWLMLSVSLNFFPFLKVVKILLWSLFLLLFEQMGKHKIYLWYSPIHCSLKFTQLWAVLGSNSYMTGLRDFITK